MYALKEKVSEKLSSYLFASSPLHHHHHHHQSQARPQSIGGRYLSSFISYVLPPSNVDQSKITNNHDDIEPPQTLPQGWMDHNFEWRDEHLTSGVVESAVKAMQDSHDEGPPQSARSNCDSDVFEVAIQPSGADVSMPNLTEESTFIVSELYEFLQASLPNIVKGRQWVLLYSTLKHGMSLRTLIRKSADLPGPCLLGAVLDPWGGGLVPTKITGDMQGAIFGGLLKGPLNPTSKRKYQGTNQTFVFTTIYGQPRLFRPTGANRYFYLCMNDLLALGGGGHFALCLDEDLLSGTSGACDTYGNVCLAHSSEFELKNVELWGFTHLSRYTC